MQLKHHLYVFIGLILGRFCAAEECPPNDNIAPCTCKNFNKDAYVTCVGLQNAEELREALAGVKGLKLYSLEIKDSNLGDIPGYMFKDTSFEDLKFSYTKITAIGDANDLPFAGLENSLKRLTLVEGFWDYDKPLTKPIPIDHLKKLTYINSENNIIRNLGNDWFAKGPVSLKDLLIQNTLATEVGDKAFAHLKNLRTLHFTGSSVTLKRSALPENPIYMDSLDLSDNEIIEFPSDFFTGLTALKFLFLNDNAIQHLPESTFKSILKQLDLLLLDSNPLDCGAKMKWIVENKFHEKIVGTCATPDALNGKEVDKLTLNDFSG